LESRPFARDRSAWANGFGAASVSISLALLLAIVGMLYETVSRRYAALSIPAPGELIDLGGRRIHLDCRGKGSPTVVFESGLDVLGSMSWERVIGPIARMTRVCAYDRAGYLWSDAQHQRRDAISVAVELRAVLKRAKEPGPFLMVGHAVGGVYAMVFAALMEDDVRGLVLLDSAHPDQEEMFARVLGVHEVPLWMRARDRIRRAFGPFWATVGVVRLQGVPLPPDVDATSARIANAFGPASREAIWSEESGMHAAFKEAGAVRDLGARWLTVLTADPPRSASDPDDPRDNERAGWLQLQHDLGTFSSRSEQQLVPGARHHIQLSRPVAVIAAVHEMVNRIRAEP
jgi:pimeloyl-ACP methyl ester carboxylesterase